MGAALTGMSLNGGLIPYGATFMCFSDYMKPAIRLAALSHVQVVYVFTHDSVGLGEDGPTHQPIEQLAGLRAIPNLYVIRPADVHETREAWRLAILRQHAPTALVLTRQKLPLIDRAGKYAPAEGARRGAYVLADATDAEGKTVTPELILLSTGSEVSLCLEAREALQQEGTPTRVVSMPCWDSVRGAGARSTARASSLQTSARVSASRRPPASAGTAGSATRATCSASTGSAPPPPAPRP